MEYVDSHAKMLLVLHPAVENSTTKRALMHIQVLHVTAVDLESFMSRMYHAPNVINTISYHTLSHGIIRDTHLPREAAKCVPKAPFRI